MSKDVTTIVTTKKGMPNASHGARELYAEGEGIRQDGKEPS